MADFTVIRMADTGDAAGIARVHVETWRSTYRGIVPDSHLDALSMERSAERVRGRLGGDDGTFTLVAEEREGIVGFAVAGPEREGDAHYRGEVMGLYVLASWQRRGVGRRLMTEAVRRLRGQGLASLLIWTLADNPCRGFYEALGGRPVRRQSILIGGADLVEVAYGWADTRALVTGTEE